MWFHTIRSGQCHSTASALLEHSVLYIVLRKISLKILLIQNQGSLNFRKVKKHLFLNKVDSSRLE